ncbi:MAG: heat-inducible transcriptional repressor HrcA [Candidatus Kaelpia aquatica]|nr:heat-inducible transcriptional repressor HrcA [Candidatus Kaelpia aquatica]
MVRNNKEERMDRIFTGIVKTYIETAMPVASKALVCKYRLKISAATVRNIMVELEELGYLKNLHTSSGRVPTDKGYRYYVNMVMDEEQLTPSEKKKILMHIINTQWDEVERLFTHALQVVTKYTNQVSVLLYHRVRNVYVEKIDLVYINKFKVLFIIIADNGDVLHLFIENENIPSIDELRSFLKFVNRELQGQSLYEVKNYIKRKLVSLDDSFYHLFSSLFNLLIKSLENMDEKIFMYFGANRIIQYPEFRNVDVLERVIKLLEEESGLTKIMESDIGGSDVNIHIGGESLSMDIENCCILTSKYKVKNRALGTIGILGPTRIPYARSISVVKYVSDVLTQALDSAVF